jgi:murein DD-endopeptidase MepM/ murein hydrolase activator NlpD
VDHGRRRGAYRAGLGVEPFDLGDEPPLSVDGQSGGLIDRRRVSVQWFSGTILTGLCGAALMGGAVFAALDGETNFATVPERVELALRGAVVGSGDRLGVARKADRLPPVAETNSLRRTIPVTQTSRGANNREIVRVRHFVRVAGNLSLSMSELSANIPAFNPQKMMLADATPGALPADDAPDADTDAAVTFFTRDLAAILPRAKVAGALPIDEVIARVRDTASVTGSVPTRVADGGGRSGVRMAYAAEGNVDLYVGIEPRIVPENITLLPKTKPQATGGHDGTEKAFTLRKGESISTILRDLGATSEDIRSIASLLGTRGRDGGMKEGQKLRILLSPTRDGLRMQPVRVVVANDTNVDAVVALSDLGRYVSVDTRSIGTEVAQARDEEEDDGKGIRLYQSIYETALRNQVPRGLIEDLVRIYSYDVDFQRKVQPGDSFEVLFADEGEGEVKSEVLFASLTTGGEQRKFYRYQAGDDGVVDYYDETGKSAKKFLVRKPLADGHVTSNFGSRKHPLLQYTRMHTGVDWAADMGTPIYASGNGVIEKIGWEGGYGKFIKIRHANGYATGYGHMSAFARNMAEGAKVRQGQIIGYVGSTGLSTGAHLHYEIMINGRHVDPMKIKLPRGRVLESTQLATFEQERDRLDNMMKRTAPPARSSPRMAQSQQQSQQ